MICMFYSTSQKKCKYIEKRVYRALKATDPLGCRNISKVIKGRNLHFRFNQINHTKNQINENKYYYLE